MLTKLTTQQQASAGRMARDFQYGTGGWPLFLNDVLAALASGASGIQSAAADVDSLSLGGGAFSQDGDNTVGLTFAYLAGRFRTPAGVVSVSAGSLAMVPSATNYVEADASGVVSRNTAGFTPGRVPLYVVVAGATSLATVASAKVLLGCTPPASIPGASLTAAAATRSIDKQVGTISGTASVPVRVPVAGRLTAVALAACGAVAPSDTNYWTFTLVNAGQGGLGSAALLAASNTTRATGGSAVVANAVRPLTLVTLTTGAELNVAANDCLVFVATATGTPPALTSLAVQFDFGFSA